MTSRVLVRLWLATSGGSRVFFMDNPGPASNVLLLQLLVPTVPTDHRGLRAGQTNGRRTAESTSIRPRTTHDNIRPKVSSPGGCTVEFFWSVRGNVVANGTRSPLTLDKEIKRRCFVSLPVWVKQSHQWRKKYKLLPEQIIFSAVFPDDGFYSM